MQVQGNRTQVQAITTVQSLAAVQTLLRAGLGCITYLRDLLPEENFTQSHLVADEESSLSSHGSDTSFSSTHSKRGRNANGFKITTMTRGYSDEADKILDYLEKGIFDALGKRYLRSFIFAIYLDSKDPNNIIEAYTFNFHYHTLPGSDTAIPVMTLGDDLQKMTLSGSNGYSDDPVSAAAKRGRVPTLLDVKKSVKSLIKTLIHAATQMDVLPKRRYATFKLFYTDETPVDYEPPHFQAADLEKDKWFFMTHDFDEMPDKWSIGKVDTGHHSVNLSVASIATYLPSPNCNNDAPFLGTTSRPPNPPSLTPIQEAGLRAKQADEQAIDATKRNIAWSVEEAVEVHDLDADGDDDPDYVRLPDGSYERIEDRNQDPHIMAPVGIRNESGEIVPCIMPMEEDETRFGGVTEVVPACLNELNIDGVLETSYMEQTQQVEDSTQELPQSAASLSHSPPSIFASDPLFSFSHHTASPLSPAMSPITGTPPSPRSGRTVQMLKDMSIILEETQAPGDVDTQVESGESSNPLLGTPETGVTTLARVHEKEHGAGIDNGLNCECEMSVQDECCFCESGCGRWYHVWCMGYHSTTDPRLPSKFVCFDCRVRADSSWELIKIDLYPTMLSRFRELALFRRAIKIVETKKIQTSADFAKALGGSNVLSRQLFKRLETEGFIAERFTTLDDLGFPETRSRGPRGGHKTQGKQAKNRRNVQKPKYKFNRPALLTAEYLDYFNPDPKVECRTLGLLELAGRLKSSTKPHLVNVSTVPVHLLPSSSERRLCDATPTQEGAQILLPNDIELKRASLQFNQDPSSRPSKKMKISMTHGLDLAE